MSSILCLWKYENYLQDKSEGTLEETPCFNSNQHRLHSVPKLGERAYIVTYHKGCCYLVARITIRKKLHNPPHYKYGLFRIEGKPDESQYFEFGSIDITRILPRLHFRTGKQIPEVSDLSIAQYLQTCRELTEDDANLLESSTKNVQRLSRNPNWVRDELILALELYFRVNPLQTDANNPEIIKLSDLLKTLPIHPKFEQGDTFRNPHGVYMKLCNFLRFDPNYKGKGLRAGSRLDEAVWNEFHADHKRLSWVAAAIHRNYDYVTSPQSREEEFELMDEDEEFPEGRILTRLHKQRERNYELVRRKKQLALNKFGRLVCEVCGFDFVEFYGQLGDGFAECHHNRPISEIDGGHGVRVVDLSIVCPNCHRMIHRARPWLTTGQLRALLVARGKIDSKSIMV